MNPKIITILAGVLLLGSGCQGEAFVVGNISVAAVPCVLLYLTLNLKKDR